MKKFLKIASVLALVTGLSSCLKDEPIIGSKPQNIVEFYTTDPYISPVSAIYPVYGKSYVSGVPGSFDVTVSYSGSETAPQDITLEVGLDETALTKFNTAATASGDHTYELLPAANYSIGATTVVIKKGTRRATFPVNVNIAAGFDFTKSYALPLTIKSASTGTISGNFGSVLYAVGAKNAYDGRYTIGGTITRNSAAGPDTDLGGTYAANIVTSVITQTQFQSGFTITWRGGSAVGGIDGLYMVVDPATNLVTVKSTGQPNLHNTVGEVNSYNPATKTFTLGFTWGVAPSTRIFKGTLTYKEARP